MRLVVALFSLICFSPNLAGADPLYDRMIGGALDYFVEVCLTDYDHGEAFNKIMSDFGKKERWDDTVDDGGRKMLEVKSPLTPLSAFITNHNTSASSKLCAVAFPAEGRDAAYLIVGEKLRASLGFAGGLTATERGPAFVINDRQEVFLDELPETAESKRRVVVITRTLSD